MLAFIDGRKRSPFPIHRFVYRYSNLHSGRNDQITGYLLVVGQKHKCNKNQQKPGTMFCKFIIRHHRRGTPSGCIYCPNKFKLTIFFQKVLPQPLLLPFFYVVFIGSSPITALMFVSTRMQRMVKSGSDGEV